LWAICSAALQLPGIARLLAERDLWLQAVSATLAAAVGSY
jgi:hypothetical protein